MKIFITLLFIISVGVCNSQSNTISYNAKKTFAKDKLSINKLNKLITIFEIFEIPIESINEGIRTGSRQFTLNLENSYNFKLNITPNNILADNYQLRTKNTKSSKKPVTSTYSGSIDNDFSSKLVFSIRANHFSGVIVQGNTTYCFEPLKKYIQTESDNKVIVYQLKDVNDDLHGVGRGIHPSRFLEKIKSLEKNSEAVYNKNLNNCSLIEIAIAADNSMLTKFGGDTSLLQTEIIDMLNLTELLYTSAPLEIRYRLVEIYITAPNEITLDIETNSLTILSDFRTFGVTGGFSNSHGVATLWTNRDFEYNGDFLTAGLAYIDVICSSYSYNIMEHLPSGISTQAHLSLLYAHELGHNWGAAHTATNTVNIMSPIVYSTNTTWSATSISSILAKKSTANCLLSCDIPYAHFSTSDTLICEGNNVLFTDTSHGNPSSFLWAFPGGNPSSSTLQNPIIQYNSAGSYDVKLVISNSTGSDSLTQINYITVVTNTLVKPTVSILSGSTTFCSGNNVVFSSSPASNYLWSNSDITNSITATNSGSYFVQISDAAGCTSNSDTTVVTVYSLPIVIANATSSNICIGDSVTLTGSGAQSYTWDNGISNGIVFSPLLTNTYTVTGTDINSCTNTNTINVSVNALPVVSLLVTDTICLNATPLVLSGGTPASGFYSGNGTSGGLFYPDSSGIGTHQINYSYTDVNSCSNSDSANITVDLCTGISSSNNELNLLVYPNPFVDELTIVFPENKTDVNISLTNQMGQIILKKEAFQVFADKKITFFTPSLSKGVYFLTVKTDDVLFTKKVIIN